MYIAFGNLRRFAAIAIVLGTVPQATLPAWSQGNRSSDSELLLSGNDFVVTATKTAQRVSDAPSAVTVIDEEMIRLSGATTIPELLRLVPGVYVSEVNQSQDNVAIRGFDRTFADKLLVMVDGRSIYQDFSGNIFWNLEPLLISQIKRIEIVRGPGSALYGANAFDGVINIITKTPLEMLDKKAPATVRVAEGQDNSDFSEMTDTVGEAGNWAMTVGAGYHGTSGYGDDKPNGVKDGYQAPIVTLTEQKDLPRGSLVVSSGGTQDTVNLTTAQILARNAAWNNYYTTVTYAEAHVANPTTARFYLDAQQRQFLYTDSSDESFQEEDRRYDFEIQQQRPLTHLGDLVYGAEARWSMLKNAVTGPGWHDSDLWSLYAQDEYYLGAQTNLFAGVRYDTQSVYGNEWTPRISLVHHLKEMQTVRLSYGTAFRAPTILDSYLNTTTPLFGGLSLTTLGNTHLSPEKIDSLEAGYRKDFSAGYIGVTAYDNWVRGLFGYVPTEFAPSPPFSPGVPTQLTDENLGHANGRGGEFESEFQLCRGLKGLFNYSYEDLYDNAGHEIMLSPRNMANFALEADLPDRLTGYVSVNSVGPTFATDQNTNQNFPVAPYTQVDARIGYSFGPQSQPMNFSIGATNVFNNGHYEYPSEITGPGGVPVSAQIGRTLWVMVDGKL